MKLFCKKDLLAKVVISNLIKSFGAFFEFLHWNNFNHCWSNSES